LDEVTQDDFAAPGIIFQMGIAPFRIDILTLITGVSFEDAWSRRTDAEFAGARYPVIGKQDFMTNKRAVGRPQDLADVAHLEKSPIQ
jgi:hypothetical protein